MLHWGWFSAGIHIAQAESISGEIGLSIGRLSVMSKFGKGSWTPLQSGCYPLAPLSVPGDR